ncbi:MAG: S41 family peptidase [Bacteroidota bacterium]
MKLPAFAFLCGLLSLGVSISDHDCPCLEDLNYTADLIATQHPGYDYFINREAGERYETGLAQLREELGTQCQLGQTDCIGYFNRYFELIPDKHLRARAESREERQASNPRPLVATFDLSEDRIGTVELSNFGRQYNESLDSFYTYLRTQIADCSQLVVDLRVNGGGRIANMEALVELIHDHKSNLSQVAILQSYHTGSAAEQFLFTVRRGMGNRVKTFGQNSYGSLAYAGTEPQVTPHLGIHFRLPTRVYRRFRPYERVGVPPDVKTKNGKEMQVAKQWLSLE